MEKPPIGLIPRSIHRTARLHEVIEAINRYVQDGRKIKDYWVREYNDLIYEIENNPFET